MTCESGTTSDFSYLQIPLTISNTADPSFTVFAPLIQINWQSSDLSSSASSTTNIASSSTATLSASSSSNTATDTKAGLATGAIVGIAIGASLVVIALAILLFLLIRKPNAKYGLVTQYPATVLQELSGEGKKGVVEHSYPIVEAPAQKEMQPAEIDSRQGSGPPVELDAERLGGPNGHSSP
jgi:hypothetical protein